MPGLASKFVQAFVTPMTSRVSPAFLAAVAFVIIQVGIGIVFKIAQKSDGKYAFSQSASISISEFCKLLLSTSFFYRQCRTRLTEQIGQDVEKNAYVPLDDLSDDSSSEGRKSQEKQDAEVKFGSEKSSRSTSSSLQDTDPAWKRQQAKALQGPAPRLAFRDFVSMVRSEISGSTVFGFAHLALLYAIINNSVFLLFRLADPGTISLVRSGITLITALNLLITAGTKISKLQWLAILFQICGVLVTQYNPESGSLYPLSTYLLLIFQTAVSASAGVYNQTLLKAESGSLHVCNMSLYAAGTIINAVIHVASRHISPTEPSFFEGYMSWGAFMVIVSNVFIGLAITAVYKYSDALVKCFATAVSTGILLYVAPLIFHVPLSFLVLPGTITVFAATYLYLDNPAPKPAPAANDWKTASIDGTAPRSCMGTFKAILAVFGTHGKLRHIGLACTSTVSIGLILALVSYKTSAPSTSKVPTLQSPLRNAMAYVRWNQHFPERIPTIMEYAPFFADMHISMPKLEHTSADGLFNNLTVDNYEDNMRIYTSVAETMQNILDAPSNSSAASMTGLMYFHFDAWVDPMGFSSENIDKIWFPDGIDPRYECMTSIDELPAHWMWTPEWRQDEKVKPAVMEIYKKLDPTMRSRINSNEWCSGWADIYYIPRHYFVDYIYLSRVFHKHSVVHELAIPTMIHIIDLMRRSHVSNTFEIMTHLSDCWGHCCAKDPHPTDLLWHRCGHKLDLQNQTLARLFYDRLDANAQLLGTPIYNETLAKPLMAAEHIFDPEEVASLVSRPADYGRIYYGDAEARKIMDAEAARKASQLAGSM